MKIKASGIDTLQKSSRVYQNVNSSEHKTDFTRAIKIKG